MLSPVATTISVYQPIVENVVEPNFLGLNPGDWVQAGVGLAALIFGAIAARNWRISHQLQMLDDYYKKYSKLIEEVSIKFVRIIQEIEGFTSEVFNSFEDLKSQDAEKRLATERRLTLRSAEISRGLIEHYATHLNAYLNAGTVNFFNIPFFQQMNTDLMALIQVTEKEIQSLLSELITGDADKRITAAKNLEKWAAGQREHKLQVELKNQLAFLISLGNAYVVELSDYPYFISTFSSIRPNEFFLLWSERQGNGANQDSMLLKYHAFMHDHDRKVLSLHRRFLVAVKRFMHKKFFT